MTGSIDRFVAKSLQRLWARRAGTGDRFRWARHISESFKQSADEINNRQLQRVKETISYAYDHCKFYHDLYDRAGVHPEDINTLADVGNLPLLTKEDIRDQLPALSSDLFTPDQLFPSATGGSTGVPVSFFRDSDCLQFRWGIDLAVQEYYDWREGDWQGWLWGASRDVIHPKGLKASLAQRWLHRVYFLDTSSLDDQAYQEFVIDTKRNRPTYISGYPSVVYDLAMRIESGRVEAIKLPMVSCTAEQMHEFQRTKIAEILTERLFERYGSREIGTASFECAAHNGQHLVTESVYFESVPVEGSGGQLQKLVVTDLVNRGMLLIRYDIGDIGTIDYADCSCGLHSPRIMNLAGRHVDILWRSDGRGIVAHLSDLVGASKLTAPVQIIQEEINRIVLRVEGSVTENQKDLDTIRDKLISRLGGEVSCRIEQVQKIERTPSGKYQYVVSKVSRPTA